MRKREAFKKDHDDINEFKVEHVYHFLLSDNSNFMKNNSTC